MRIIDSTLREGEQMAGVYLSLAHKVEIVRLLGSVGVDEIELGPSMGVSEMVDLMTSAKSVAPLARLAVWSRCLTADIQAGLALHPDVLNVCVPVSDLHLEHRLRRSRRWALEQIELAVGMCRDAALGYVSIGFEDTTRAAPDFLNAAVRCAVQAGADRIRFADTLGLYTPHQTAKLVEHYCARFNVEFGVHMHNDFGMATANAIAALQAGAAWADATVLGLGERAGNTRLEEVVGYLALRGGMRRYVPAELSALCAYVSQVTGIRVSPHHPLVGSGVFACESGIHLDGIAKDPSLYEPYDPAFTNQTRVALIGKKAGANAIRHRLSELGVALDGVDITACVAAVRTQSRAAGRPLTDDELRDTARNTITSLR